MSAAVRLFNCFSAITRVKEMEVVPVPELVAQWAAIALCSA